ncbi:MAG: molybdopterin-dependent oxidoreductase [Deltaproteobacteria bacterium]|nr:molybdopterin-dependent oxidoreductase [Deltaproteobacteria bacterium]
MKISRRDFLHLLGVTGALAGGISQVWAIPDKWRDKLRSGPRIETWKVSTCGQCPAGCGIRIRLIDDIPVRILGNPIAPVNKGFTCPMGESGLELLYHPDRIDQPLRRKGKKGESSWEPISWDEATKQITRMLQGLVKEKQTGRLGFLMGDRNTLLTQFAGIFTARSGSSNFFPWRTPGINELGFWQATGEFPPFSFDLTRTDYLITFGTNLLEEPPSPVYFNRIYGKLKESRMQSGLKMVHVDARMSQAGKNATEWVQTRPGSMGALALGMAYVIIRDKNLDQDFINLHTRDFRKGNGDFLDLVTRDYSPERASEVTGVPAETIIRLARAFGSAKAPLALSGGTSDTSETALFTQWAVASLNALTGSLSAKGLWREPVPLPWGSSSVSTFSPRSTSFSLKPRNAWDTDLPASWIGEQLPNFVSAGKIADLKILMIAQANPVYQASNQKMWKDWLGRIPLVVQLATLLDDTSPYADLVLPATTYLEQWDLTLPVPNLPFSQLGLQQPVAPPLTGARPLGDVLLQLGKGLGANLFPESDVKSYGDYVQVRMKQIFASGKGTPYFEEVSLAFLEELRKRGWQVYSYPAFSDFRRLLQEKGGWWDPGEYPEVDWKRGRAFVFPTVPRLAKLLEERSVLKPGEETQKRNKLPHLWLEENVKKPETPDSFILAPFTTLMNMNGDGASQPLLQELFGLYPRLYWNTWAEMNPKRAKGLSIEDGDLIRVSSKKGSVTLPVKIVPTVSPEILSVPFGQGHTESGKYAKNVGTNPITIIDPRVDPLSGRSSWHSTHVRVEKIKK